MKDRPRCTASAHQGRPSCYVLLVEVAGPAGLRPHRRPVRLDIGILELGRGDEPIPPRGHRRRHGASARSTRWSAMGLILVYRGNRIINFAQAQLGAVPAVIALLLIAKRGVPYLAVLPIVILGGALLGGATEVTLVRRFSQAPRLIVTVVTIGVAVLLVVARVLRQAVGRRRAHRQPGLRLQLAGLELRPTAWGVQHVQGRPPDDRRRSSASIVVALGAFFRSPTWASPCGPRPRTASAPRCSASP